MAATTNHHDSNKPWQQQQKNMKAESHHCSNQVTFCSTTTHHIKTTWKQTNHLAITTQNCWAKTSLCHNSAICYTSRCHSLKPQIRSNRRKIFFHLPLSPSWDSPPSSVRLSLSPSQLCWLSPPSSVRMPSCSSSQRGCRRETDC